VDCCNVGAVGWATTDCDVVSVGVAIGVAVDVSVGVELVVGWTTSGFADVGVAIALCAAGET
jgi:hypothetical protein